uniref:Uncharacterized protein n=1 Tax=Ditylenchus dipsaci TaxID=166011 RepID=A0A915DSV8_9BILA
MKNNTACSRINFSLEVEFLISETNKINSYLHDERHLLNRTKHRQLINEERLEAKSSNRQHRFIFSDKFFTTALRSISKLTTSYSTMTKYESHLVSAGDLRALFAFHLVYYDLRLWIKPFSI